MTMNKDRYTDEYTRRLQKIEERISSFIPEIVTQDWITRISGEIFPSADFSGFENLLAPARALFRRGGKRWRPFLMVCLCEMLGGGDSAYPLSPLVEIPHNGSLIIDDIEDQAELRRGETAIHILYGTDTAINTGNFLYFLPILLLEDNTLPYCPEKKLAAFRIYTENLRRLHLGQGLDIFWHNHHSLLPSKEEYLRMCSYKTGSLSRMAAQLAVVCADADNRHTELLGSLSETLGVAFQILDDVINLETGNPGKQRGDDLVEGKKSLPVLLFLQENPEQKHKIASLFTHARSRGISGASEEIEETIMLMKASGSIEKAKNMALSLLNRISGSLLGEFKESIPRDLLIEMIKNFSRSD